MGNISYVVQQKLSGIPITAWFLNLPSPTLFGEPFSREVTFAFSKIDVPRVLITSTGSESVNTYDNYGNIATNVSKVGDLPDQPLRQRNRTTATTTRVHNTFPVPAKPIISQFLIPAGMPAINATGPYTKWKHGSPNRFQDCLWPWNHHKYLQWFWD